MALKTASFALAFTAFWGVNFSRLQDNPVIIDVPDSMADNDTVQYVFDPQGDISLPPQSVRVYTHTSGDITNTVDATWSVNNGDTLIFSIDDAGLNTARTPSERKAGRLTVTHALASVTNGAATAAQVAASINADTNLRLYVYAVAGLTANRVTLFPRHPLVKFNVSGGTAQTVLLFPAGDADWSNRVFASQADTLSGGTGWSWTYNASTRTLTIQNETGGAVARTCILVYR